MLSSDLKTWTPEEHTTHRKLHAASADEAMQDGMNARWGGMGKNDNPYARGTLQHDRWIVGWLKEDESENRA